MNRTFQSMKARVAAMAAALALTFGLIGISAPSAAADPAPVSLQQEAPVALQKKADCIYANVRYSDGSVIRQADGYYYKCYDGTWVFQGKYTAAAPPSPLLP